MHHGGTPAEPENGHDISRRTTSYLRGILRVIGNEAAADFSPIRSPDDHCIAAGKGTVDADYAGRQQALAAAQGRNRAGVIRVDGSFARGDAVVIRGPDGAEVGRGLVAYDAEDAAKIKGRSSADILSILGFGGRAEMVHRDDLVVGRA